MELDAQVEESLQDAAPNPESLPEQKPKHKKKDKKHKHKHHKKAKRERPEEDGPRLIGQEATVLAEGEVARTGSEDGELPGPPAVEGFDRLPVSTPNDNQGVQEPVDDNAAGHAHGSGALASSKRRYVSTQK